MSESREYILCLGSNTPDKARLIVSAQQRLNDFCSTLSSSGVYEAPDESGLGEPYVNVVLRIVCRLDPDSLRRKLKTLEKDFGRTDQSKAKGIMPLDADIIICDSEIIDRYQYGRDYFKKGYQIISE